MARSDPWRSADDPLGEALHFLQMRGAFYCRSEFSAPWGLDLPAFGEYLWFHVITAGSAIVEVEGADPQELRAGDLALVPHGDGHRLLGAPGAKTPNIFELEREPIGDRYEVLRHGGGGERTEMVCGAVGFDHPAARNLVALLPRIIRVDSLSSSQAEWIGSTLRLIGAEARARRPGGETVITRLCDVLVIQAIRAWIDAEGADAEGWLGALRDEQVGRAIALIHREPERAWTVEELARELAMSRSAFAARFSELVGEPAIGYVTRWRMNVALAELRDGASVPALADRFGYRSEAAFRRAFKRTLGIAPGAVRRQARELVELG